MVHNHLNENEFNLLVDEHTGTKPRFDKEEMAWSSTLTSKHEHIYGQQI